MNKLKDVTLLAIVRDELINPAGGIINFLDRHIPLFDKIKILDTGSKDGTRKVLDFYESKNSNISVYDSRFVNYATARNELLNKLDTKYGFFIDADELLTAKQAEIISQELDLFGDSTSFELKILDQEWGKNVAVKSKTLSWNSWNNRVLQLDKYYFSGSLYEFPVNVEESNHKTCVSYSNLIHFSPMDYTVFIKHSLWYANITKNVNKNIAPSETDGFIAWKTPSMTTLNAYGINFDEINKKLVELGVGKNLGVEISCSEKLLLEMIR